MKQQAIIMAICIMSCDGGRRSNPNDVPFFCAKGFVLIDNECIEAAVEGEAEAESEAESEAEGEDCYLDCAGGIAAFAFDGDNDLVNTCGGFDLMETSETASTSGPDGCAGRSFDGSSYLISPDWTYGSPWAFGTGDIAFEAWVRYSELNTGTVIGQMDEADRGWRLSYSSLSAGFLNCEFSAPSMDFNWASSTVPIILGEWHHIRCERVDGVASIYVDGVNTTSGSDGVAAPQDISAEADFVIGKNFVGDVDNVWIGLP